MMVRVTIAMMISGDNDKNGSECNIDEMLMIITVLIVMLLLLVLLYGRLQYDRENATVDSHYMNFTSFRNK